MTPDLLNLALTYASIDIAALIATDASPESYREAWIERARQEMEKGVDNGLEG